jgi:histidine triad (HIT) family protein
MNCIFCQILAGNSPGSFVYQDDQVAVLMDINQPNSYKVLVVPREHVPYLYDLNESQAGHMMQVAVKVAKAIRDITECEGFNLMQFNGEATGQEIFHVHLHLLPRFVSDDVVIGWPARFPERPELDRMAEELRVRLGKNGLTGI